MSKYRCRHHKSWFVAGGHIQWCYEFGAIRKLALVEGKTNVIKALGWWAKPTGKDGKNPYTPKFNDKNSLINEQKK
mgnify:CR=1 FL=1